MQTMGFEPMPLSRLAPKASALTTRPNLLYRPMSILYSHIEILEHMQRTKKQSLGGLEPPTPRSEV